MPLVEVELEIWCTCGEGLCGQSYSHDTGRLEVEPCEKCLNIKYQEGYDDGYNEGLNEED